MNWDDWPKCMVPACQNKCCLALKSKYCWPHTKGTPEQARDNLLETEHQGEPGYAGAPTAEAA